MATVPTRNTLSDRLVMTYYNMHHRGQSRGEEAGAFLTTHGIQAMALQGGFPAWKVAELPEESTAGEPGAGSSAVTR
jgi:hypothetical protein